MRETDNQAACSRFPRLADFAVLAIVLGLLIMVLAPQQMLVTVYKLSLVALAAWVGYRIDRSLFPYARPHELFRKAEPIGEREPCSSEGSPELECVEGASPWLQVASMAMLRRAIVIAAVVLAVALGA